MAPDRIGEMRRLRRTAETWLAKAAAAISALGEHRNEHVRAVAGWEAAELLARVLDDAEHLVALVDEDRLEDVERKAKAVYVAARARRLAGKLDRTDGRTDAETAAFARKAAELRR